MGNQLLRSISSSNSLFAKTLTLTQQIPPSRILHLSRQIFLLGGFRRRHRACVHLAAPLISSPSPAIAQETIIDGNGDLDATEHLSIFFPLAGLASSANDAIVGFITGKRKATEVAHSLWRQLVLKGDIVVDATCGNGHDTLALLKMVADEAGKGRVYGLDIQQAALESTSSLLEASASNYEKRLVKLFLICHSKMEDIVPADAPIRLVAFNLGYLPGGDKMVITAPETTLKALEASSRIVGSNGLISLVIYVGHPGGREELKTVEEFSSTLPSESWVSCKLEVLNRPASPVLVLLFKK